MQRNKRYVGFSCEELDAVFETFKSNKSGKPIKSIERKGLRQLKVDGCRLPEPSEIHLFHGLPEELCLLRYGRRVIPTDHPTTNELIRKGFEQIFGTNFNSDIRQAFRQRNENKVINAFLECFDIDTDSVKNFISATAISIIGLTDNNISRSNEAPSTTTTTSDAGRGRRVNFADDSQDTINNDQLSRHASDISELKSFSKTIGNVVTDAVQGLASNVQGLASMHGELVGKHGELVDNVGKLADTVTNHEHRLQDVESNVSQQGHQLRNHDGRIEALEAAVVASAKKASAKKERSKKSEDDDDDDDDTKMIPLALFPLEEEEEEDKEDSDDEETEEEVEDESQLADDEVDEDEEAEQEVEDESQLADDEDDEAEQEVEVIVHQDAIDHEAHRQQLEEDEAARIALFKSKKVAISDIESSPRKRTTDKADLLQDPEESESEAEEEDEEEAAEVEESESEAEEEDKEEAEEEEQEAEEEEVEQAAVPAETKPRRFYFF